LLGGFARTLIGQAIGFAQRGLGLGLLAAQPLPGCIGDLGRVFGAQCAALVDLGAVVLGLALQRVAVGLCALGLVQRLLQRAARLAGAGEQLATRFAHQGQHLVAGTGRHLAQRGIERALQMAGRMLDGRAQRLCRALLDPQQAGDAPVLLAAGALGGKLEAQPLGQKVLGLLAFEPPAAGLQLAALLAQEALAQPVRHAVEHEVQLDGRRGGAVAVGAQVVDAGRAVTLEEGGADGAHQGALAAFVGAGDQVQPRLQLGQLEGRAELPQLGHLQPRELQPGHGVASAHRRRSASRAASRASASCATRASSPAVSRSSAMTSPR
jgi:hypothetical protein